MVADIISHFLFYIADGIKSCLVGMGGVHSMGPEDDLPTWYETP
jgi:hypothetical protein